MAQRIGFYTLKKYSRLICIQVPKFKPLIAAAFPGNTAILLLLDAAVVACAALFDGITALEEPGV